MKAAKKVQPKAAPPKTGLPKTTPNDLDAILKLIKERNEDD